MAYKKSKKEMKQIQEGGKILGKILAHLETLVKPGVSTLEIDQVAEKMILEAGGIPAFKGYRGGSKTPFPGTICASVNEEVVHGIPSETKILKEGDIFTIDIGMQWPANCGAGQNGNGFFTDTAVSIAVGEVSEELKKLMDATYKSLQEAIKVCVPGNTIADVGRAVEDYIRPFGYGIVTDLTGHGVGHGVHEEPYVPNYYSKELEHWEIQPGVVIAIEPMITIGNHEVLTADDGWAIETEDYSLSAHYEHTIVITEKGPVIATKRPGEKI